MGDHGVSKNMFQLFILYLHRRLGNGCKNQSANLSYRTSLNVSYVNYIYKVYSNIYRIAYIFSYTYILYNFIFCNTFYLNNSHAVKFFFINNSYSIQDVLN